MKRLAWIISILPLMITAVVLPFLPESVPMHYDIAGNIDRWGSKYENLIFPVFIFVFALIFNLLSGFYERRADRTEEEKKRAGDRSNAKILSITGAAVTIMFSVMQCFLLYGAYTGAKTEATTVAVDIGKVSCILLGMLFIVLGNFMTKTRINSTFGLRISWSMYNDNTWRKSNRFAAYVLIVAGILTIITALIMKSSYGATMVMLGYLGIVVMVSIIYARKVYVAEKQSEENGGK